MERSCADTALKVAKELAQELGCTASETCPPVAKISLSGTGMRSHTMIAARILKALADGGLNVAMINTSEMRFNLVVDAQVGPKALELLKEELKDVIAD